MVLWNQRMNLLTGDAKYIDVLERSLYNGALDGLSLSGDRFFYGNPLAADGTTAAANGLAQPAVPPYRQAGGVAGELYLCVIRQCRLGQIFLWAAIPLST